MLAVIDPRVWLAFALAVLLSFFTGYGYKAYRVSLDNAAVTAKQDTAQKITTTTVQATDKTTLNRLTSRLATAEAHASRLETLINEASHARTPAAVDADCRLPDRLRDAINADLAPGAQ